MDRIRAPATRNRYDTIQKSSFESLESIFACRVHSPGIQRIRASPWAVAAKVETALVSCFVVVRFARNDCHDRLDLGAVHVGRQCGSTLLPDSRIRITQRKINKDSFAPLTMDTLLDDPDWNRTCMARRESSQCHDGFNIVVGHDAIHSHGVENVSIK